MLRLKITIFVGLGLVTIFPACPLGVEASPYTLNQESFSRNGVMVSRPDPDDENIYTFLSSHRIATINEYAQWLSTQTRYKKDVQEQDIWKRPAETLRKKYGDCEDFALLSFTVLRILGHNPRIIILHLARGNHALCIAKVNGRYVCFDNNTLQNTHTTSLRALIGTIASQSNPSHIYEYSLSKNRSVLIYKQS